MTSHKKIQLRLETLGETWRKRPSIAKRVRERLGSEPTTKNEQPTSWLGGLTMTQRLTYGSACAATFAFLIFFAFTSSPTLAFAQVAENIANAKSYSVTLTMEVVGKDAPNAMNMTQTVHARLPDAFHKETRQEEKSGKPMHNVNVTFRDRPGIDIDHLAKTYRTIPPAKGSIPPLAMMEKLGQYTGKAQKNLGSKKIDATKCDGFEIELREIDPDAPNGKLTVWVNADSKLPHQAEIFSSKPVPMIMKMRGFVWNTLLDDALFDTMPPEAYVNKTKPQEPTEMQVKKIVDAFKLYAKLSGGHYPKVGQIYGDTTRDEMAEMAGFSGEPNKEWLRDPKFQEINASTAGFGRINMLQRNNPDVKYFGKTVGPLDSAKALLYWRLADGEYQVIYGDLKSESVTAEELRSL